MCIFQDILDCRSMTIIGYKAEDELQKAHSPAHEKALRAILATNQLDEIWAVCHEQLGNQAKADELRAFMRSRKPTPAPILAD